MSDPAHQWRIGLTGGIGSGKTTVAGFMAKMGATVLDADALARACTAPGGAGIDAIANAFGKDFIAPDGSMDRQKMRDLVFSQPSAKSQLEAIIHPLVKQAIEAKAAASASSCVVFDVPLLVESAEWPRRLDRVWVVDCTESTQRQRVMARNGWDTATIDAVISAQSSRLKRLAAADAVIFNEGYGLERLLFQVKQLALEFGL